VRKLKIKKFLYSQKVAPYVFVIPFILSFAIFWIYPLCSSVFMSFEKITPLKTSFVGIENYKKLLSDTVFQTAIKNSATYMFWTLVLLIPFPMLFAVLMDSNLVKAKGVWKAVLYMPALTSVVISGTLFRLMFTEYSTGQMNKIVMALGMEPFKWLKVGWTGMAALLVLACWRWTGVNMLYFLSLIYHFYLTDETDCFYFFSFYPHFFHSFFLQFRQKAVKIIEDLPENISHQKYRHNHSDNTAYTDCKSAHRAFHFPDLNRFRCSYRMAGCPYGKSCRNRDMLVQSDPDSAFQ